MRFTLHLPNAPLGSPATPHSNPSRLTLPPSIRGHGDNNIHPDVWGRNIHIRGAKRLQQQARR